MAKTDRVILIDNDQQFGQVADPNKLETMITHAYDKIDENDTEFQNYQAGRNITRERIVSGAVGKDELDATLWEQTASKAKFNEIDAQFADIAINVKNYGAKGDGVTDDTTAIQSALDYGGKVVYFPEGTYIINSTIKVPTNVTLKGVGVSSIIKAGALLPTNVQLLTNKTLTGSDNIYYDNNIKIETLYFDGNNSSNRTTEFLSFSKVFKTIVRDCYFINIRGIVVAVSGSSNVDIENCTFQNNGFPKPSTASSPCVWTDKVGNNISKDINVINCKFIENNWSGCYFMPKSGKISGCYFFNNGESSIFMNGNGENVRIEKNYIFGATRSNISASGIELGGHSCIVSENIIDSCGSDGISLTDTENIIVSNNVISNNGQETGYFPSASGIAVITVSSSPIPNHIKISNNRIMDMQGVKTQAYGISIGGSGSSVMNVAIVDNDLIDFKVASIQVTPGKFGVGCYMSNNLGHASAKPVIGEFQAPATTGNYSVTGIGFRPRSISFMTIEPNATNVYSCKSEVNETNSKCHWQAIEPTGRIGTTVTGKAVVIRTVTESDRCVANLVSFDEDGFTLNFSSVVSRPYIAYTALP